LSSQSTGGLEAGKSGYDKQAFLQFIDHWKAQSAIFSESRQVPQPGLGQDAGGMQLRADK